jgi:endonuclease/exonuclease/phosphatase family metal-dependent hydrolase
MSHIRVMSFNIFSPGPLEPGDELPPEELPNDWEARAPLNVRTIQRYAPDLIGFQEMEQAKLETYQQHLTAYRCTSGSDEDLPTIFWREETLQVVEAGRFWLSSTPDERVPDWGVPYPLTVEWARFRTRDTAAEVLHLNTQYEDGPDGILSRPESSRLLLRQISALQQDEPVAAIITGDFNCNVWSEPYRILVEGGCIDTYRAAGHGDSAASSTFHGFRGDGYSALDWGDAVFWRVDWIFTLDGARRFQTTSCTIVRDAEPPVYPSDHYPIVAEVLLLDR